MLAPHAAPALPDAGTEHRDPRTDPRHRRADGGHCNADPERRERAARPDASARAGEMDREQCEGGSDRARHDSE